MAPMYRKVKSLDGRVELEEIKATCAKHEQLCREFGECSLQLQQNDAQLDILSQTAILLKQRHGNIALKLAQGYETTTEVEALEDEISRVDKQVAVWMSELEEVNENRLQIEIEFLKLTAELKKSVTHVQLASIDFELIQLRHADRWKKFLDDHGSCSPRLMKIKSSASKIFSLKPGDGYKEDLMEKSISCDKAPLADITQI